MSDDLPPISATTGGVFGSRSRAIRLLLANDEEKFFDAFRPELDSEFEVVATARTSEEALHRALDHRPDVVLLGDWKPEEETANLRRIKALPRAPRVLVLADRDCQELCLSLLAAGADACLPKSHFPAQWRSVIRRLALPS
jgi:DNA-binding NarL/FixJ family response regulator